MEIDFWERHMGFDNFIKRYPRFSKFNTHQSAEKLFEFLCRPVVIDRMITINDYAELSALDGVVQDVEKLFGKTNDFDLEKHLDARQMVGAMIKFILEPFGYVAPTENRVSVKNSKIFRLAMHYAFDPAMQKQVLVKSLSVGEI
jgi:hypothetical protein